MSSIPRACREVREDLTEYLDEALPIDRRQEIASHLEACSGCAHFLSQLRISVAALRSLPDDLPPPELKRRLLEEFRRRRPS